MTLLINNRDARVIQNVMHNIFSAEILKVAVMLLASFYCKTMFATCIDYHMLTKYRLYCLKTTKICWSLS